MSVPSEETLDSPIIISSPFFNVTYPILSSHHYEVLLIAITPTSTNAHQG